MEKLIQKWTDLLNTYLDFGSHGEKPLTEKGALVILLITVIVLVPLLFYLGVTGPEQLPGT